MESFIGEGRPLDPDKDFIILPGQFGNGFSSSPSNTAPPSDPGLRRVPDLRGFVRYVRWGGIARL